MGYCHFIDQTCDKTYSYQREFSTNKLGREVQGLPSEKCGFQGLLCAILKMWQYWPQLKFVGGRSAFPADSGLCFTPFATNFFQICWGVSHTLYAIYMYTCKCQIYLTCSPLVCTLATSELALYKRNTSIWRRRVCAALGLINDKINCLPGAWVTAT